MSAIDPVWTRLLTQSDPTRTVRGDPGATPVTTIADGSPSAAGNDASWHRLAASGEFEPVGLLGSGGMGEVMLVTQTHLGRQVAVKVLGARSRDPQRTAALQREARIAARIDHPNVIPVHDVGADFFVMRRIRGHSLAELLTGGHPLAELVAVLRRTCDAVACAHEQGIVHRDIKPANIMVGDFGEVMLVDWGLAVRASAEHRFALTAREVAVGTPAYLPPEVAAADNQRFSEAVDVYLLGATLYHLLTGRAPHRGLDATEVVASAAVNGYTPVAQVAPDAPQRLVELQERTMATDPPARGSVTDLRDGLVAWLRSLDDERRAGQMVAAGDRYRAEAMSAHGISVRYEAWHRAEDAYLGARALWADCRPAQDGLARSRRSYALAAVANGDFSLAAGGGS